MTRVLQVAWREFASTVLTKGFIIGVVLTPVFIVVAVGAIALTKNLKGPQLAGQLAVLDRSGVVGEGVARRFSPEGEAAERERVRKDVGAAVEQTMDKLPLDQQQKAMARGVVDQELDRAVSSLAGLRVRLLETSTDDDALQRIKDTLAQTNVHSKDPADGTPAERTVGLIVVPREAVFRGEGGYAQIESFWPDKVDFEIRQRVHGRVGDAVIDARVANDPRLSGAGLSAAEIRALLERPRAADRVVTAAGIKRSGGELAVLIPAAFMVLLMIALMSSGQMLLTTTIEEKGSRVMEVLLSAVSPMQLMLGKIVGQLCVGLLMLVLYSGMGIAALIFFSLGHLVDPFAVVYLVLFFLIAYFILGSLYAAIGSAVTELREAQTLMTPLVMVVILPWLLWLPISRAPNSMLSVVLSFVPGVNPFVMVMRLTSSEPPPAWQTVAAIVVGVATAAFCAWFSAKVFRVGVLMYGKPPDLRTLVRWVRMA